MAKRVRIPVVDFATPAVPKGDLQSGPTEAVLNLGAVIHSRIQEEQAARSDYRSEVPLSATFSRDGYEFAVAGRADGIYDSEPRIEEIKSAPSLSRLERELEDEEHPYRLQLLTYCHLYRETYGRIPSGGLLLVSSRTGERRRWEVSYDPEQFEAWLGRKLEALVRAQRAKEARIRRRKRLASQLEFPFSTPRPGQKELMERVGQTMAEGGALLVQAPTGLGKTMGILYPALEDALSRGTQVIYVTPKNSQFSVAVDAVRAMRRRGVAPRVAVLSARGKACIAEELLNCDPEVCSYSRGFYDKYGERDVASRIKRKKILDARTFRNLGEEYGLCPYGLSMVSLEEADLIVCDYNYVFSPRSSLASLYAPIGPKSRRLNLIIDEAHNLYERAMDYYSPRLALGDLSPLRDALDSYPAALRPRLAEFAAQVEGFILAHRPAGKVPAQIAVDGEKAAALVEQATETFALAMSHEEADTLPILELYVKVTEFAERVAETGEEFVPIYGGEGESEGVAIRCLDASRFLAPVYSQFHGVVAFSATFKPFEFFRRVSGFAEETDAVEFESSFPARNRKVLVIPQISTAYRDRERNYGKVGEAISRIIAVRPGHYVAFFPSYGFLEKTLPHIDPGSLELVRQTPGMTYAEIRRVSRRLEQPGEPYCLVLAVQGGGLAEGVDLQGEGLKGALVVGPAMPLYDFEREKLRSYYDSRYEKGYAYAYTYPAMIRSIQAAGRIIRSERKRGLLVFLDRRFTHRDFAALMPRGWFRESVQELVSDRILAEVRDFWEGGGEDDAPGHGEKENIADK